MTIGIRKAYVDCSAGQLHYRHTTGGGGVPVVCLHQTASSSQMWLQVMTRLGNAYTFYAFDTPGFGGSFDPEGMPSMTQYMRWLLEGIDTLGLREFHLLGHHTGACIAVELAARHPERVRSLMMIGPVPLTQAERDEFRKHYSTPFTPTADGSYLKQTWDYLATLRADLDLELHHREMVDTLRAWLGRFKAYSAVWDQDFPAWLSDVRAPLLFMSAPDDVLNAYFERAREQRPDAAAVMLSGANFEPDLDPDGTAAAVQRFLSQHG